MIAHYAGQNSDTNAAADQSKPNFGTIGTGHWGALACVRLDPRKQRECRESPESNIACAAVRPDSSVHEVAGRPESAIP